MNLFYLISVLIILLFALVMTMPYQSYSFDIDVKCTIHENDSVDVRIFVLGLDANSTYTAEVVPDKSPTVNVAGETDSQGVIWMVAKINNGDKDSIFKVILHEGKNTSGHIIVSGDDRAPCHQILASEDAS